MSIFEKFEPLAKSREALVKLGTMPLGAVTEEFYSGTEGRVNGHRVILAGTNNYMGLTFDPDCIAAAKEAVATLGTGTTGSRMANGSYAGHVALEQEIARFFDCPAAIVFSTGFLATQGMVSTLCGPGDFILLDGDCHASIYEGTRVGGAEIIRFRHNDPADLEKRLRRLGDRVGRTLIIVEGVYSMLGDVAPLAEIVDIKRRYGGYLMVDEAHSMGVMGKTGRGLAEELGVEDDVDFIVGTFSKSLGSVGGYCVSKHPELELVRYAIRPYIFTASLAPSVIASTRKALEIIETRLELRTRLWDNARRLYDGLKGMGFKTGPTASPVVAVEAGEMEQAVSWWNRLMENGVYVNLVLPPATPTNICLLRCSMSAAHTPEQVDRILDAYATLREPNYELAAG